jgi:hypothetical protein
MVPGKPGRQRRPLAPALPSPRSASAAGSPPNGAAADGAAPRPLPSVFRTEQLCQHRKGDRKVQIPDEALIEATRVVEAKGAKVMAHILRAAIEAAAPHIARAERERIRPHIADRIEMIMTSDYLWAPEKTQKKESA